VPQSARENNASGTAIKGLSHRPENSVFRSRGNDKATTLTPNGPGLMHCGLKTKFRGSAPEGRPPTIRNSGPAQVIEAPAPCGRRNRFFGRGLAKNSFAEIAGA